MKSTVEKIYEIASERSALDRRECEIEQLLSSLSGCRVVSIKPHGTKHITIECCDRPDVGSASIALLGAAIGGKCTRVHGRDECLSKRVVLSFEPNDKAAWVP